MDDKGLLIATMEKIAKIVRLLWQDRTGEAISERFLKVAACMRETELRVQIINERVKSIKKECLEVIEPDEDSDKTRRKVKKYR